MSCASASASVRSSSRPSAARHRARDLRHFDGVSQAVAEVIGNAGRENLRLIFQPAKCPRMDYAVAIALEFVAVRMRKFRIEPAAALFHRKTQARQPVSTACDKCRPK